MLKVLCNAIPYLVVNIGYIHHKIHIEAKVMDHNPPDNVRRHIIPRVPQMRMVIDRRSAYIPGHFPGLNGHKRDRRPWLEGIVDF
jgi:hypothetical protein